MDTRLSIHREKIIKIEEFIPSEPPGPVNEPWTADIERVRGSLIFEREKITGKYFRSDI